MSEKTEKQLQELATAIKPSESWKRELRKQYFDNHEPLVNRMFEEEEKTGNLKGFFSGLAGFSFLKLATVSLVSVAAVSTFFVFNSNQNNDSHTENTAVNPIVTSVLLEDSRYKLFAGNAITNAEQNIKGVDNAQANTKKADKLLNQAKMAYSGGEYIQAIRLTEQINSYLNDYMTVNANDYEGLDEAEIKELKQPKNGTVNATEDKDEQDNQHDNTETDDGTPGIANEDLMDR